MKGKPSHAPDRVYTWHCEYCGQPFKSKSHAARYCCTAHKQRAWREHKSETV